MEEKRPGDRVEGTRNVELEEHTRGVHVVELTGGLLNKNEVVVDAAALDEGALVGRNHDIETRSESE